MSAGLETYREKRDFTRTPEPQGGAAKGEGWRYVIQKHAARRMHYDLRLELGGVLKSWAVTRGPSLDPRDKRLAVAVEDHPIEYGDFEGVIPAGEYGGGTVLLWDRGTWRPDGDPERGLADGLLKFHLQGEKLRGGWALVRMHDGRNWLLVKERDDAARQGVDILSEAPLSVVSHEDLPAIAAHPPDVWRADAPRAAQQPGARPGALPQWIEPQLARLASRPPEGNAWLHEIKFDGYRALCRIADGQARLLTRGGHDWTDRFGPLAAAVAQLPCRQALLDGEVVVLDASGASNFGALQDALAEGRGADLMYFAFDLLHLDGTDLTATPLEARKAVLAGLLVEAPANIRYSDHVVGRGGAVLRQACAFALEGIVSKRLDGRYTSGREGDWLKAKCTARQEFVIAGFTPPSTGRQGFGALLLGVWQDGRLHYAGKVGSGFSERVAADLDRRLRALARPTSALANPQSGPATWVEPALVAEVEFSEWTRDGLLRHPRFRGLRADKEPTEVRREAPAGRRPVNPDNDARLERFPFTHPDRVLWGGQGVTKRGLAGYYAEVAELMLPHVAGRPLSLLRCPEGEGNPCFFQRHGGAGLDPHIRQVPVPNDEPALMIDDVDGLFALVQMGVLEIHPWGCRAERPDVPDRLCLDLDPDPTVGWPRVIAAARELRRRLADLGLDSFVKTTGGKGLHIVVPVAGEGGWAAAKGFCKAVAERLAKDQPAEFVATVSKVQRRGRIFIDYMRNDPGATWVAPYSTRARPGAPVSVPLAWEELDSAIHSDHYTANTLGRRLAAMTGDPWAGMAAAARPITAEARRALGL